MNNAIVKYTRLWFVKLAKIQREDHDVLIRSQYDLRLRKQHESKCQDTPAVLFSTAFINRHSVVCFAGFDPRGICESGSLHLQEAVPEWIWQLCVLSLR